MRENGMKRKAYALYLPQLFIKIRAKNLHVEQNIVDAKCYCIVCRKMWVKTGKNVLTKEENTANNGCIGRHRINLYAM